MFEKIYDRLKREARSALVLFALAAAGLGSTAIALGFLCAAGFIYAMQLGPIYACLIAFGVFLFGALFFVAVYTVFSVRRRRIKRERAAAEAASSPFADPRLLVLGLRIVQAVGVRRLLPIVALGAAAFALASGSVRARAGTRDRNSPSD